LEVASFAVECRRLPGLILAQRVLRLPRRHALSRHPRDNPLSLVARHLFVTTLARLTSMFQAKYMEKVASQNAKASRRPLSTIAFYYALEAIFEYFSRKS
jgi:hypothetical protein